MADAIVSFALENLSSMAQKELEMVSGAPEEIEKLSSSFTAIRAVLSDAESREANMDSVRDWVRKLKDVAYDVDDVLDEWTTNGLRSQIEKKNQSAKVQHNHSLSSPYFSFNQAKFRSKIGRKIKKLREKLDAISDEKNKYQFSEDGSSSSSSSSEMRERQTSSFIDERYIFGRREDKEAILSLLLSESSDEWLGVPTISIIGMGGLGKTTLAQQAYNDERVKNHFDFRIWVYASEDFNVIRLTKEIIENVTMEPCRSLQLDTLQKNLCKILAGKRFLLVLDDVWEENQEKCRMLKLPLENGVQGCRIVVTTRNLNVSNAMGTDTTHRHRLEGLLEEDCWSLFKQRALTDRTREECLKLEEMGRNIVKKCKGVPLAVKVMGSMMQSKRTNRDWECILESNIWDLEEVGKGIYPALLLSYYNLPSKLKQCLMYCSLFPKDYEINCNTVIKLWMAEGFISTEEIGDEYFNNLLGRSLFQDVVRDDDGYGVSCKMHDIIHDLTQFITQGECHIIEMEKRHKRVIKARHLGCYHMEPILTSLHKSNCLRTILLLKGGIVEKVPRGLFSHLRCLRVLDLSNSQLKELPSSIGNLIHIRYLDLSRTKINQVPESLTNLCNLLTLRLNDCYDLQKLPEGVGKLINLRHLEFEGCSLMYLPKGIARLKSLRMISKFMVGDGGRGCKIGALKHLDLLHGKLVIVNLERVESGIEGNEAQLKMKKSLHSVVLSCNPWSQLGGGEKRTGGNRLVAVQTVEEVLESLQPNTSLIVLRIEEFVGYKFPSWMEDSLFSNLTKVELVNCHNCIELPNLGRLPSLCDLYLDACYALKAPQQLLPDTLAILFIRHCGEGDWMSCIPPSVEKLTLSGLDEMQLRQLPDLNNLNYLEFSRCYNLTLLPDGFVQLKKLLHLKILDCPTLSSLPEELKHLTSLQQVRIKFCPLLTQRGQKMIGEDWHKIAHVANINIEDQLIQ